MFNGEDRRKRKGVRAMIKTEYEISLNRNTLENLSAAQANRTDLTIALVTDLHEHDPSEVLKILGDAIYKRCQVQ